MHTIQQYISILLILTCLAISTYAHAGYATTKYPVVFVHGSITAKNVLGIVPSWYGIPEKLKRFGNNKIFVANVAATGGPSVRVPQLSAYIDDVLKQSGATKVHLIGHSQGGMTIRAYSAFYPERVASLTSISSPNHGTKAADVAWGIYLGLNELSPELANVVVSFVEFLGWTHGLMSGDSLEQDLIPAFYNATTQGALEFGREVSSYGWSEDCNTARDTYVSGRTKNLNGLEVTYAFPVYSWSGKGAPMNLFRSGEDLLDPSAYILSAAYWANRTILNEGPNDGVVSTCSNRLGKVISENYYWSHFDEVNHVLGLTPNPDPRSVMLTHMNRLKNKGL